MFSILIYIKRTKKSINKNIKKKISLTFLPEQELDSLGEVLEVVMAVDRPSRVEANITEDLHANNGVEEEEHGDEQADVGQGLD